MIRLEDKKLYAKICEEHPVPLFSQSWWMDAVCGEDNWEILILLKEGRIMATMPYYLQESNGRRKSTKAPLTQTNGIWFNYPSDKIQTRLDYEEMVINETIDYIETLDICKYEQQYTYSLNSWLPFYWRGFHDIARYTYVIEDTKDMEAVWNNFTSNVRKNIRKAKRLVKVRTDISTEEFYRVNVLSFQRQEIEIPYTFELFRNLVEAGKTNQAVRWMAAVDGDERIHAVICLFEDRDTVYLIFGGADPELRNSQAYSLLVYESIVYASEKGKKFDFEGSVKKNIEHSFREYGGIPRMYLRIVKEYED